MNQVDLIILLIAGIFGVLSTSVATNGRSLHLGWLVFSVWVALKLVHVL